jgi:hypothetical protein
MNPFSGNVITFKDSEVDLYSLRLPDEGNFTVGSYKTHIMVEGETLQSISFKYFGTSEVWADIADTNLIFDPFSISHDPKNADKKELYPGKILYITM